MISIALQRITDALDSISGAYTDAIVNIGEKGGTVTGGMLNLPKDILTIPTSDEAVLFNQLMNRSIAEITSSVSSVGDSALRSCKELVTASFPNAIHLGPNALEGCIKLASVDLPECLDLESESLSGCAALATINIPECKTVFLAAFKGCTALESISIPRCQYIYGKAFSGCSKLKDIHIGLYESAVCRLFISDAFENCPSLEHIYVPNALVNSYKSATNWVNYASKIVGE